MPNIWRLTELNSEVTRIMKIKLDIDTKDMIWRINHSMTKNIESRQATLAMYSWLLTPEDE
jgi:hypothetical protein